MTLWESENLGVVLDSQQLHESMTIIELDHKCIQCRRMTKTQGLSMFRSCRSRRSTWTGRLSTSSPSLRLKGRLPASLIDFYLICSPGMLGFFLSGRIDFVQRRLVLQRYA
jgi:hypothetical protein